MKLQKAAAVADAYQDRIWQGLAQKPVHGVFEPFVHGRAGFVQKQHLLMPPQGAADGETLLFAQRQNAAPVGGFVEPGAKVAQLALLQHLD